MSWSFSNDKPIFQQLVDIITLKIISGEYGAGSKLEAVRELAVVAGVNPNTMQRALTQIEGTGLIFTKRGDGRYVTEDEEKITAAKNAYVAERVRLFIESVKALGLDEEEILKAVNNELGRQI
ncbi:MAG: GntR family transcriptional regulator [Acutalibacteraceae bacterium]|nr:GntR family transcriptional regulator [Acutalibacteraceae bacterium]